MKNVLDGSEYAKGLGNIYVPAKSSIRKLKVLMIAATLAMYCKHPDGPPNVSLLSYCRTQISYSLVTVSPPKTKLAVTHFSPSVSTNTKI